MPSETSFSALPVRQRGTLEIIDTAMKLYRRYFGVLMGWSALVAVVSLLASTVPFGSLMVYPMIGGSCACCIAAAVRGQRVSFGQVWDFTKPRYGALLLVTFLSLLLLGVALGVVFLVVLLGGVASAWLLSSLHASDAVTGVLAIIGVVVALVVGSILSVFAFAWSGLAPIIACLEDDKRGAAALGRAWELMKGEWLRVLGLASLLTIAVLAVLGIVGGAILFFSQSFDAIISDASSSAVLGLSLTFAGFFSLFFLFWNPIQTLILAVLYLDLRVRKEALDLEWSSYASGPSAVSNTVNAVPAADESAGQTAPTIPQNELSPASMSAPGSVPILNSESNSTLDSLSNSPTELPRPPRIAPVGDDAPAQPATQPAMRPPAPVSAEAQTVPAEAQENKTSSFSPPSDFDFSSFSAGAPDSAPDSAPANAPANAPAPGDVDTPNPQDSQDFGARARS